MQGWVGLVLASLGTLATVLIAWSALKPRQRLFATRLASKWLYRLGVVFVVIYVLWVNISFWLRDGPIGRSEVMLLLIANSEALIILFTSLALLTIDRREERWKLLKSRISKLEDALNNRAPL
jgi:type VI protein secretion system component VasK